jgi:hypothetical protein
MNDEEHEILKAWHANGITYELNPYGKIFAFARALLATPAPLSDEPVAHKLLAEMIDILDDGMNNAPEHRCYVEGAWNEVLDEARAYLANPSDKQEAVAQVDEGDDGLFVEILHGPNGSPLKRGDKLYAAPLAQSAEQDRIDAERYRWLKKHNFWLPCSPSGTEAAIDAAIAKEPKCAS